MDDPDDLVLGMFAVAIAAVMLVAGDFYLVMRPDPPETYTPPPSVVTSSLNGYRGPIRFQIWLRQRWRYALSNKDEEVDNGRHGICSDAVV
jgi:hypothetical protein